MGPPWIEPLMPLYCFVTLSGRWVCMCGGMGLTPSAVICSTAMRRLARGCGAGGEERQLWETLVHRSRTGRQSWRGEKGGARLTQRRCWKHRLPCRPDRSHTRGPSKFDSVSKQPDPAVIVRCFPCFCSHCQALDHMCGRWQFFCVNPKNADAES